jgi:hypothetical protein
MQKDKQNYEKLGIQSYYQNIRDIEKRMDKQQSRQKEWSDTEY